MIGNKAVQVTFVFAFLVVFYDARYLLVKTGGETGRGKHDVIKPLKKMKGGSHFRRGRGRCNNIPRELCETGQLDPRNETIFELCDPKSPLIEGERVLACAPIGSKKGWTDFEN